MPRANLQNQNRTKGIALILLSTLSFGFMQIFVAMTNQSISVMEQTFSLS